MNTKQELLTEIHAGRERLEAALAPYDTAAIESTLLPNGWSLKDLLAHIAFWEQKAAEIYRALLRGDIPDTPDPANPDDVNRVNAQAYETYHRCPVSEVQRLEAAAYDDLLNLVEKMPDADLFDPQRFPWLRGDPFAEWIIGNTSGHYDEHLAALG